MVRVEKPAEGSWTAHYPELGTGPMSYEDSISPEFYELEREAIFKRSWLNVGRVEQLPRKGSYFTKELAVANTSVVVVRGMDGEVRAFHNICRHRGNKLVWTDFPREESSGSCRQFVCKYHGWKYELDGACSYVQQENEFFDLDKADYGLVPVHCDVWSGFVFVNLAGEPSQTLAEFLGPMITAIDGYPFDAMTERFCVPRRRREQLEALHGRLPGVLPRTHSAREAVAGRGPARSAGRGLRRSALRDRRSAPAGDDVRRSGLAHAARDAEADGDRDAQRPVRSVGRARSRRRRAARRRQPREQEAVGPRLVPALAELRDPDLGARLVPHVPLLADVLQHARVRGQPLLRSREDRARTARARDGRGHVQGVRAPGREHARGDADRCSSRASSRRSRSTTRRSCAATCTRWRRTGSTTTRANARR